MRKPQGGSSRAKTTSQTSADAADLVGATPTDNTASNQGPEVAEGNATESSSQPSGEVQQPSENASDDADGAGTATENTAGADGADAGAAASDERRENADQFADRAGKQQRKARKADAVKDYERAKKGCVPFAELSERESLLLRFADSDGFLPDAPPKAVARDDLAILTDGRAIYNAPVDFGIEGTRLDVTEAWLIAGDKAAVCHLVVPLPVGGGRHAQVPSGNLIF